MRLARAHRSHVAQFGRYDLVRKISSGGMGEVYLARVLGVEGFQKPVAVKRIYPHLAADEMHRKLFAREANLVAQLDHPNIVQVLELGARGDELFMAMEFVHGSTLAKMIDRLKATGRRLSPAQVAVIAFDLLDALDHAHNFVGSARTVRGIVHADVSPQNVMLNVQGVAKLCDFGVAKILRDSTQEVSRRGIWGKIGYMSPEQTRGDTLDARTDIYSLGVVLHEALTGERLFTAKTLAELLDVIADGRMPRVRDVRDDVPVELESCVMQALETNRDERFPTAAEFRTAIEEYLISTSPAAARRELRELVREIYQPIELGESVFTPPDQEDADTPSWRRLKTRVLARADVDGAQHTKQADQAEEADLTEMRQSPAPRPGWVSRTARVLRRDPAYGRALRWSLAGLAVVLAIVAGLGRASRSPPAPVVTTVAAPAPLEERAPPEPHAEELGEAPEIADATSAPVLDKPRKRPGKVHSKKALLTLNAVPWGFVTIDGARLDKPTPIFDHALDPGPHVIVVESPSGKRRRLEVDVAPGERVRRVVDFEAPHE